jgi:hypothetical protein
MSSETVDEWYQCAVCRFQFRSREQALRCCSDAFDDPDGPTVATDGGAESPPDSLESRVCTWCSAPLPEAGARYVVSYDREGRLQEARLVCDDCSRKGMPGTDRRRRLEWAWKIEPQMSRLERLGWWLIGRANR